MRRGPAVETAQAAAERLPVLLDMYRVLHLLTEGPARWESRAATRLASVMEAYVAELQADPRTVTVSSLRTFAQGVDLIAHMLEQHTPALDETNSAPLALVVDDEPLSRRLANHGLKMAGLTHVSLDASTEAHDLLQRQRFDLVVMDINMPELDGFELCRKMRLMPFHATTPVVFVTGQNDLRARAQASLSGGTDFISKPFHCGELAVKALGHLLRARSPRPLGDTAIFTLTHLATGRTTTSATAPVAHGRD